MPSHKIVRTDSMECKKGETSRSGASSSASAHGPHTLGSLDDPTVLEQSMRSLSSFEARNFVVCFNDDEADVAFDLSVESAHAVLNADAPQGQIHGKYTRWINVWYPFQQRALLDMIGRHFDFSPRLLALMCSDPHLPRSTTPSLSHTVPSLRRTPSPPDSSLQAYILDIEQGREFPDLDSLASHKPARTGNLYDIVDDIWHYTSFDQGRGYLCLGYNSIYNTGPLDAVTQSHAGFSGDPLPHCKRVWTWLLLCADRTVITINEDLYPHKRQDSLDRLEREILLDTRRNMINVFRSLSHVEQSASESPLTLLPIRQALGHSEEDAIDQATDAPGVLFYYLFENWFNSYSLVTRRESRYGIELVKIRNQMFKKPRLEIIDRLDQLSSQLRVLQQHYTGHIHLISRVISSQPIAISPTISAATNAPVLRPADMNHQTHPSLTPASRARFLRLSDMLTLYALSATTTHFSQATSLATTNFSLIAMAESDHMEVLTRVSLLIAKATVLFLPVSLMTAYFGLQLRGAGPYGVPEYWIAFAAILSASWVALVGFGVGSGSTRGWTWVRLLGGVVRRRVGVGARLWRARRGGGLDGM